VQEVYDYASRTLRKMQEKFPSGTTDKGLCCACQAAGVASQALARSAREKRYSRDDITILLVGYWFVQGWAYQHARTLGGVFAKWLFARLCYWLR
jgi:hypothetical protein